MLCVRSVTKRDMYARLGWLVRVNRRYGACRLGTLAETARAFRQKGHISPSVSTLSRWESGRVPLTHSRIAAYERALGLPQHALTAVADVWIRYATATTNSPSTLVRQSPQHRVLDHLLESAIGSGPVTGADWHDMTVALAAEPRALLSPRSAWGELVSRLVMEANVSDGLQWMLRTEALSRLLTHPVGQDVAISTVQAIALDRSTHSMAGTVSALEATRHSSANSAVVRLAVHPVDDRIFHGAVMAAVRKVRDGHFTPPQLTALVAALVDRGDDLGAGQDLRSLVDYLIAMASRRCSATEPKRARVEQLVNLAWAHLGADPDPADDAILREIITEMLYHQVDDVRLFATYLLWGTPYRGPLAEALTHELRAELARHNARRVSALLEVLRVLGGPNQRRLVEKLLLTGGLDPGSRVMVASTLAHIGGRSPDLFWQEATRLSVERWRFADRSAGEAAVVHRLAYALGMTGQVRLLKQMRFTRDLPIAARVAAAWWLDLPPHITAGVRQ